MLDAEANLVMTHNVRGQIKSLLRAPADAGVASKLIALQHQCHIATFSFVRTVSRPIIEEEARNLVSNGLGLFCCKQTGDIVEQEFKPANYVPLGY